MAAPNIVAVTTIKGKSNVANITTVSSSVVAEVFRSEGSGRISGLSWAEGLVELPGGAADIEPGTLVRFIPYGSFGL